MIWRGIVRGFVFKIETLLRDLENEGVWGLQVLVELVTGRHGVRGGCREDQETPAFLFGELVDVVPGRR